MKTLLFLRRLGIGGTERQFVQLAHGLVERGHAVELVAQLPGGELAGDLDPGVRATSLFGRPGGKASALWQMAQAPRRLRRVVEASRPDVVYSALYFSNAHAHRALAPLGRAAPPLVWGFRDAGQDLGWLARRAFAYGRRHAPGVPLAIFNSTAGRDFHERAGLRFRAARVVPNGIDTERFAPAPEAARLLRAAWGIPADALVVGTVGRQVEKKDLPTLLDAAARLAPRFERARFVLVGDGEPALVASLRRRAGALGLADRVHWSGPRQDLPAVYGAFDLFTNTSLAEGFSNAIGEAMACAAPCVVTDVGDSAALVGTAGTSVPAGDAAALARAWEEVLALSPGERRARGAAARERVATEFSVRACVERTAEALEELVAGRGESWAFEERRGKGGQKAESSRSPGRPEG